MQRRQAPKYAPGLAYTAWSKRTESKDAAFVLVLAVAVAVVVWPVTLVAAGVHLGLRRKPDARRGWIVALLGAPGAAGAVLLSVAYLSSWWDFAGAVVLSLVGLLPGETSSTTVAVAAQDWLVMLGYGIAGGPLVGSVYWRADQWYRERAPLGGETTRQQRQANEQQRRRERLQCQQRKRHEQGKEPRLGVGDADGPYVGLFQDGDLDWGKAGRPARLPWKEVPHLAILGASGSGKSEEVYSIAEWLVSRGDRQVIYLNCKEAAPGHEPARRLLEHAAEAGLSSRTLLPEYAPYDVLRGTASELRNRLMDIELFSEPHHEAGVNLLLAYALEVMQAEGRSPGTLSEVLWQLTDRSRLARAADHDQLAAEILRMIDERSWKGTVQRYASNAAELAGWIGPSAAGGWAFEDAQVCALDLPTSTQPRTARMLLRLLLADLIAYTTHRRRPVGPDGNYVPLVVILEEISALDADPVIMRKVINLMERSRAAGVKFILVAQDPQGLGDERTQDAVLTSAATLSFAQITAADRVASLAGTRVHREASGSYDGRIMPKLDTGIVREQYAYKIPPDELRQLPVGECYAIHRGQYARLTAALPRGAFGRPMPPELDRMIRAAREGPAVAPTTPQPELQTGRWA